MSHTAEFQLIFEVIDEAKHGRGGKKDRPRVTVYSSMCVIRSITNYLIIIQLTIAL